MANSWSTGKFRVDWTFWIKAVFLHRFWWTRTDENSHIPEVFYTFSSQDTVSLQRTTTLIGVGPRPCQKSSKVKTSKVFISVFWRLGDPHRRLETYWQSRFLPTPSWSLNSTLPSRLQSTASGSPTSHPQPHPPDTTLSLSTLPFCDCSPQGPRSSEIPRWNFYSNDFITRNTTQNFTSPVLR